MSLQSAQDRTLVMGVVNVTPDSFYDGGRYADVVAAEAHARALIEDGADILDIGGESSRPGAAPLTADEEWARIGPALERILPLGAPVSVDTYHAETARRAAAMGAAMINDITALRGDPNMAAAAAESGAACVLMHMQGMPKTMQAAPKYDDVIDEVCAFFEERIAFALERGIRREALWLDPGFGFGKTVEHNLILLRRLSAFRQFGLPILIGVSNKSTIGAALGGAAAHDRTEGTAAAIAISIHNGADAVRVHDVKTMKRVARVSDAIIGRGTA